MSSKPCILCALPCNEDEIESCEACGSVHHFDCLDYVGGCAVLGCSQGVESYGEGEGGWEDLRRDTQSWMEACRKEELASSLLWVSIAGLPAISLVSVIIQGALGVSAENLNHISQWICDGGVALGVVLTLFFGLAASRGRKKIEEGMGDSLFDSRAARWSVLSRLDRPGWSKFDRLMMGLVVVNLAMAIFASVQADKMPLGMQQEAAMALVRWSTFGLLASIYALKSSRSDRAHRSALEARIETIRSGS